MPRSPTTIFRLALYAALVLQGFSIVVATATARPGPRIARREKLVDLIAAEDARTRALRAQLDDLQEQMDALRRSTGSRGRTLAGLRARIEDLRMRAGLEAVEGPGVAVVLRDSRLRRSPTGDPNDLVIHEQDLQAVVNALWSAGAEAMSINSERVTAGSAVRCVGNTLLLHGSVYAPPYRIAAVGDASRLLAGLESDPLVERFRIFAQDFQLGFDVRRDTTLRLRGFRGVVVAHAAHPA